MGAFRRLAIGTVLPLAATFFQCAKPGSGVRHFDAPAGIAVVPYSPPNDATSPADLYAMISDPGHYAIRRVDLVKRRLVEPRLPVGHPLGSLVAHAGASGTVDVLWGIDTAAGTLVKIDPAAALTQTVSVPPTSSACCTIDSITVRSGLTPSQVWTVRYDAGLDRWEVRGDGVGVQKKFAKTDAGYESDNQEVVFRIRRTGQTVPTDGETISFSTSNGVTAAPLTGKAISMVKVDDTTALVSTEAPTSLLAMSLQTGAVVQTIGLSSNATPAQMDVAPDASAVYVADLSNPVVYRVDTSTWIPTSLPMPVPMRDVAVTGDGKRLFAMAADADDVFVFSLPDLTPVDFTPLVPGADPLSFTSPIRAMAPARLPHPTRGSGVPTYPVFLTTHGGSGFVLQGGSGCIDFDDSVGSHISGVSYRDDALPSAPLFRSDIARTSRCGGVLHTETWQFLYDGIAKVWRVTGSFSGVQKNVLVENVPYTSDRGEFTVEIDTDANLPTDDGDEFVMGTVDGTLPISLGFVPGRPVFYQLPPDPTGRVVERALVPNVASDSVYDVDIDDRRINTLYR